MAPSALSVARPSDAACSVCPFVYGRRRQHHPSLATGKYPAQVSQVGRACCACMRMCSSFYLLCLSTHRSGCLFPSQPVIKLACPFAGASAHRSNTSDPRGFTCKLSDFGFVAMLQDGGSGSPTIVPDEPVGTITHMAPGAGRRRSAMNSRMLAHITLSLHQRWACHLSVSGGAFLFSFACHVICYGPARAAPCMCMHACMHGRSMCSACAAEVFVKGRPLDSSVDGKPSWPQHAGHHGIMIMAIMRPPNRSQACIVAAQPLCSSRRLRPLAVCAAAVFAGVSHV